MMYLIGFIWLAVLDGREGYRERQLKLSRSWLSWLRLSVVDIQNVAFLSPSCWTRRLCMRSRDHLTSINIQIMLDDNNQGKLQPVLMANKRYEGKAKWVLVIIAGQDFKRITCIIVRFVFWRESCHSLFIPTFCLVLFLQHLKVRGLIDLLWTDLTWKGTCR